MTSTVDVSTDIVGWAKWAVANQSFFNYDEERPFPLFQPSASQPITDDCSATVTLYYWLAGAPDPNGSSFGYDGYGNTDSLAANGTSVANGSDTRPSDLVIYYSGSSTVHTAVIIEPGNDPLTVSHGSNREPAYINVSQDGRPHRYFRFDTTAPAPTPPTPVLTEDDLLLIVTNPNNKGQAVLNLANGTYYGFPDPDMLSFYQDNGVKPATRQPTKAEWAHFTQSGTI